VGDAGLGLGGDAVTKLAPAEKNRGLFRHSCRSNPANTEILRDKHGFGKAPMRVNQNPFVKRIGAGFELVTRA
jgi:hypothetical protein